MSKIDIQHLPVTYSLQARPTGAPSWMFRPVNRVLSNVMKQLQAYSGNE
ncbi:hypothetical protein [Paenibacillus sp. Soil750]|nr:hypothetical protein [Paenibacillus sp. Soil750]